ncbi:neprilysin-4-like [Drosophila takahashii]|uniref:neprilysin-4-like n=1 Tax=Drosophila takahashii TaxID=29030 RepID=UPI0038995BDB
MGSVWCSISSVGLLINFLLLVFPLTLAEEPKVIRDCKSDLTCHADRMKSFMNFSTDPCDNFYEYACGNHRQHKLYQYSRMNYFGDSAYILDDMARELLDRMDLAESLNVSRELRIAQRFYNTCLEADLHPFSAADPNYLNLIRSIGGFPAVDGAAWNASNFNWVNMSAHLSNYGARGLIHEEISSSTRKKPYLSLAELGFDYIGQAENSNQKNSTRVRKQNQKIMRTYLRSFNLTGNRISQVIDGVLEFWRDVEGTIIDKNIYDLSENFDISSYFKIAWNLDEGEMSHNTNFEKLDKVCARHPEAVANYLAMQLLYAFDANLQDIKYQKDYCAATMRSSMWPLFKKLFLADTFSDKKSLELSEIVQEVRSSWRKLVEKVDWLDSDTRQKALLEESSFPTLIGSREYTLLTDRLVQEILHMEVTDGNYAATNMNLLRLKVDIHRFSTRLSTERSSDTRTQEGMFSMNTNLTIFPGNLHPPAYHHSWPHSLKFGTLGFFIGQQLSNILIWQWQHLDLVFKDHNECLANTFSKHLKPKFDRQLSTLFDTGGLRQAFEAYRSHRKQILEHPEQEMPGLDLLPEQLFFLGFTQMSCYEHNTEWGRRKKFKVLSALSNSEDFIQAFNCPVESGMRPAEKTCHLW